MLITNKNSIVIRIIQRVNAQNITNSKCTKHSIYSMHKKKFNAQKIQYTKNSIHKRFHAQKIQYTKDYVNSKVIYLL